MRGCGGSAGRSRCRGRPAPPDRGARRASFSRAAAPRSRRRTTARPRRRRSARAGSGAVGAGRQSGGPALGSAPATKRHLDLLAVLGDLDIPSQLCSMRAFRASFATRLAVHEIRRHRRRAETAEPAQDLARIGVRRHRVDLLDSRADRHVLAVDLDLLRAVDQLPAARAGRLEADEEHRVARVGQARDQVMQHAAAGRHAARRDDDRRRVAIRRAPSTRCAEVDRRETPALNARDLAAGGSHFLIELVARARVELQCRRWPSDCRRRPAASRAAPRPRAAQPVQQLFDAADGKRRNDHLAAARDRLLDDPRQRRAVVFGRMQCDRRRSIRRAARRPSTPGEGSGRIGRP